LVQGEDPRRRRLVAALTAGLLGAVLPARAQVLGRRPARLPAQRSIYRLTGRVTVNGAPATEATRILPGDTVETGPDGEVVFVVGGHSMLLRGGSRLVVGEAASREPVLLLAALRLVTGAILQVSRNTRMSIQTPNASFGIRGTGWYAEAAPDLTYFCTCYGVTDAAALDDPASRRTVQAYQHDQPLYVVTKGAAGERIRNAPFINHADQELMLIETLVGRETPYVFPLDDYAVPRREY